jgi:hypothetical protein
MGERLTYSQMLLDPRWQRRRLEVFQRDGWRCRHCNAESRQLHAHHIAYLRGLAPWDYDGRWLVSLCDRCHEAEHRHGDAGWASVRVEAVNAGAVGASGQHDIARTVGALLAAAHQHGFDAVADAMSRLEIVIADAAADRLDAQRAPRTISRPYVMDETARRWACEYEAAEADE